MPWNISKRGGKFLVKNKSTGHVAGTHASREDALAQMRALYASVPDAANQRVKVAANDSRMMEGSFSKPITKEDAK